MFYIYLHLRKSDNKPFYIGKGTISQKRAYSHSDRNQHWRNTVKKHGLKVEILAEWAIEQEAFEHEKFLISCFKDMGHKLVNMTDGGEGMSGFKHTQESIERGAAKQRGRTKETHPGVAKSAEAQRGRTKEKHKYLAERSDLRRGTRKETHGYVARQSKSLTGRTKETHESIAISAEKRRGRTKETHEYLAKKSEKMIGKTKETNESVAKMAETKRGRTKETHSGVARMAEKLTGRTKETHEGVRKQAETMSKKMIGRFWVNNGAVSKFIDKDLPLPEGFVLGRIKKAKA